jgi:hypothetical protein
MRTSTGRVNQLSNVLLFHFFLLLPIIVLGQKSLLQQPVTLSVSDKSIAYVLDKLSDNSGVRFTYNPDDISADRRISLQVKNRPLAEVLTEVFGDNSLAFSEKGEQVIIYRDRSVKKAITTNLPDQQTKKAEVSGLPVRNESPEKKKLALISPKKVVADAAGNFNPDTLYITRPDTILVRDTLIRVDTIILRDTVFFKSESMLPKDMPAKKNHSFFADLSGSYLLSEMILSAPLPENDILATKLRSAGSHNLPGYSAGAGFGYQLSRWAVRSGIYYTRFHQTFNYSYEHQTGGYFETDTIERYYTLSGPDTSWFYVTDSTWLEKQVRKNNYRDQNQFSYIEFPLSVSYSIYRRNFEIYLSGGVIAGILPSAIGNFIDPHSDYPVTSLKDFSLNTFILSVTGGAGARFSLNSRTGLFVEIAYRKQLSSVFRDYPVTVKFGSKSFRLGLSYNF